MVVFKISDWKNRRKVDFYTNVVATTAEDRSSRCRIWRYGENTFPSMRTASFLGMFTSGRRSRGRPSDLLKVPNAQRVALCRTISVFFNSSICFSGKIAGRPD